jgi:hypothetical protein
MSLYAADHANWGALLVDEHLRSLMHVPKVAVGANDTIFNVVIKPAIEGIP